MTRHTSTFRSRSVSNDQYTLASFVGTPLVIAVLLLAVSYPTAVVSLAATGLLVGKLLQIGLTAYARRTADRIREFSVPGVGTVRFRIVPR